jgi:hypothetical protein
MSDMTAGTKPSADVQELFEKIKALSPADQLRFAAELLEHKMPSLALPIVEKVASELRWLRTMGKF